MNNIELKYHRALQPVYEKAMGTPIFLDRFIHIFGEPECYYLSSCYEGHIFINKYGIKVAFSEEDRCEQLLRIPLTIDSEHPERGLLGMLKDWYELHNLFVGKYAVTLYAGNGVRTGEFIADTPTLALLKTLVSQGGVSFLHCLSPQATFVDSSLIPITTLSEAS